VFTGIVEELGRVRALTRRGAGWRLEVEARRVLDGSEPGGSVAVNGACLTVVATGAGWLGFDLAEETLAVTTLGALSPGDPVNLERPLRLGAPLGGHLVLGHVDGVGVVTTVREEGEGRALGVAVSEDLRALLIPKGSVAVDGVSLTVARLDPEGFAVALIPHTLESTTLGSRQGGDRVNLEMDVLGKYVRALLTGSGEGREALARRGLLAEDGREEP